jgi:hypothetical protein
MPLPAKLKRLGWLGLNLWIVFHFAAVCVAPASVPPATSLAQSVWGYCSGYLQMLYLNHGYHYFAPEPSGATLVSYEVTLPDGSVAWNRMPNRELFPRVRYHRQLVLTEQFGALGRSNPDWQKLAAKTFAAEIAKQHQANQVSLSQVQHELSTAAQVRAGRPIDDPLTYNELWLGDFRWDTAPLTK